MDPIVALSRELIEKGSKSFAMAAKLLPRGVREDAMMLYGWCRYCDDVIDDQVLGFAAGRGGASPAERLAMLREKTEQALKGEAVKIRFHRARPGCPDTSHSEPSPA